MKMLVALFNAVKVESVPLNSSGYFGQPARRLGRVRLEAATRRANCSNV